MSLPRLPVRPIALPSQPAPAATGAAGEPLHVVYVSGGSDFTLTIRHLQQALERHGLRHASLIADASLGANANERKLALLSRLRGLFEQGRIGPETRIVVQLHGGADDDGFRLSALDVIEDLPLDELRAALRFPVEGVHWQGDVILGCCEAGQLGDKLPPDEGTYFLLAGKKSLAGGLLREQLLALFDYFGAHLRKHHRLPSSARTWDFLTQISGENIRRVDALGLTRTKAGQVYVRKPRPGETGKRAMQAAHARQPSQILIAKLVHGSVQSVAAVLRANGNKLLKDPLFDEVPPLGWLMCTERDLNEKAALLFAAGYRELRSGDSTLLHLACHLDQCALLRALLALEIDVDLRDSAGRTALHDAAGLGRLEAAHLLLEHRARPTAVDAEGNTPLQLARQAGHAALVALLSAY